MLYQLSYEPTPCWNLVNAYAVNFPFVNGCCHLKGHVPFLRTVDAVGKVVVCSLFFDKVIYKVIYSNCIGRFPAPHSRRD